ncbi:MAG: amino acid adenylation domain-containing protein [Nostoc sp.]|uniref:amino acid adenylation domain-containing protein n=1 Tax=Nostoc sp. TaxID=1180 RepID=UPI002FF4F5D6
MSETNNKSGNRSKLKQILLQKRLQGELTSKAQIKQEKTQNSINLLPTIAPNPDLRSQPFPLTEVQQAYWIGRSETFELGNVPSHIYLEIESDYLDLNKFTQAWQQLIDRHDMLRAIILPDGQQQILPKVPAYEIAILNLRKQSPEIIESQLIAVREHLSHQMLPNNQWPLFEIRASLLDNQRTRLHFSFDLLICDAQSFQVLFRELTHLYQNPQASLPPLELSFRDYVLALNSVKESEIYQNSIDYWQKRLATLPPAPELPLINYLAAIKHPRFVHRSDRLEPEIWQQLKTKANQAGLTPSGVLLAAYAEVLSFWSKNPRFTINLTLFNRLPLHPQVNDIIGDFTSLNLLTIDNSIQQPFVTKAKRIQQQLWEDLDHRYIGGITVLRELAKAKGRVSSATMPVVFTSTVDLNTQDDTLTTRLGKITDLITQTPQVWLDHQVQQQAGALVFHWDAIAELFPANLLDDMFNIYCCLLKRLATEEKVWQESAIDLLPQTQQAQQAAFNRTDAPIPSGLLPSQFETQVRIQPDHPAIITPGKTLTYVQLSQRTNQVGHRLRALGICPNQLVAIVMEKGWEQVVAALGILAAGSAYLPIDPNLPQQRLWQLLECGEVQLVLTQWQINQTLQWPEGIQRICLDTEELATENKEPLQPIQTSEDLAYVIYTSGSTGLPKGVMIDHRGALNTIIDINQRFNVSSTDRVFALSSLSFDLSVYDIFGTLAAGATIVIPEAGGIKDPAHWLEMIVQHQVTLWNSVPALMQMLVDYVNSPLPDSLRLVLLSGDWLPLSLPEQVKALVSGVEVISLGGATEASIWSILYPITTVDSAWKSIPYGFPMANQRFYVLNEALKSCPMWVPGQLYIGGIGLAQGYWRDAQKTAASFITHPETDERLYRTGDLGRYLPDGTIEFLGREDSQVKVQGYRIELGEIEATLKQHPAVKAAVVSTVGNQLVTYVVPDEENFERVQDYNHQQIWRFEIKPQKSQNLSELENLASSIQDIDRLSTAYICSAFRELGVYNHPQESHKPETLVRDFKILPRYQKLLGQWLGILQEDVLVQYQTDGNFVNLQPLPIASLNEIWHEIVNINQNNQSMLNLLHYIKNSGENLTAILKGEKDPLELLFPDGSWEVAENLYQFNPVSAYINSIVQQTLKTVVQLWPLAKPLRILELGAGTGGTTAFILPILPPNQTQYTYTDVSSFFLNLAKKKFLDYSFVKYKLLDINKSFDSQGYESHSFDIIVAANVLHDAHNLSEVLKSLKSLLAPNGLLLLLETTKYLRINAISVGLIEGLSQFEDERIVENTPFLSVEKWQNLLYSHDFYNFLALPQNSSTVEIFGQTVMLAQTPSSIKLVNKASLFSFLKEKLPEYMIPSTIITLATIPLTANGKVDRKSLPQPTQDIISSEKKYIAPRTKTEKLLTDIWTKSLVVERVGIYDNFFSLGGDSLLGIQIIAQAKQAGIDLKPRQIFQYPTIAELASLDNQLSDYTFTSLVKIKPEGNKIPLFCIHSSSGSADSFALLSQHLDVEQPLYGLQSRGMDDSTNLLTRIEDMAEHYIKAIRSIQPFGPYHLCGWSMGGIVAYEMAQQLNKSGETVGILALLDISANQCYQQLIALSQKAEELGLLSEQLSTFQADILSNVSQINLQAMLNYTLQKYPSKITIFKAAEQPKNISLDPDFGWSVYAQGGIEVHEIPGDHFSILKNPYVKILTEKLDLHLNSSLSLHQ